MIDHIKNLIDTAQTIVIMQADNPDADSLASALALEQVLGDAGKEPLLYCGVHIPDYLHYLPGWDRVSDTLPVQFDLSIIVDSSADSLFGVLGQSADRLLLAKKPCLVIDHHDVEATIPYATIVYNQPSAVATGEVIYELAPQLGWQLNIEARQLIAASIMADSLGLTTDATSARSIHIIGELVESGVNLAGLEDKRRMFMRMEPRIIEYKGKLLQRIEYHDAGLIATITIPWEEIEEYSYSYNPSMLVLNEMRLAENVAIAIAFKTYNGPKITAKIRANYGFPIANKLAEHFAGGGHAYSSGFKVEDGRPFADIKAECIKYTAELLDSLASNE